MPDCLDSVNAHARQVRTWSANAQDAASRNNWAKLAADLDLVVAELRDRRQKAAPLPTKLGDLSDLPPDLRAELMGVELDELEEQLVTVINSYGGTADLNQILVGLFRKFKVTQKRRVIQQRLWRMQQDSLVSAVPKKKGTYSTKPPAGGTVTSDEFGSSDFGSAEPKPKRRTLNDDIPF